MLSVVPKFDRNLKILRADVYEPGEGPEEYDDTVVFTPMKYGNVWLVFLSNDESWTLDAPEVAEVLERCAKLDSFRVKNDRPNNASLAALLGPTDEEKEAARESEAADREARAMEAEYIADRSNVFKN